ncbi:nucleotide-diphospho-sugar transferase [Obelidium mucronatum]|nr:nucleotide-diphospho-sugar transferase [Obelidium mucronatum]
MRKPTLSSTTGLNAQMALGILVLLLLGITAVKTWRQNEENYQKIMMRVTADEIASFIPEDFEFFPSVYDKPLKPKAIISMLTSGEDSPSVFDAYFTAAVAHVFTFTQYFNSLNYANLNYEYVVMVTENVSARQRSVLLRMGARVLVVPSITRRDLPGMPKLTPRYSHLSLDKGGEYEYVYSKLQMWRLEGVFETILFHDLDLFFLKDTDPAPALFKFADAINSSYFLAAAWDCCDETLNSGLMVFSPNKERFKEMKQLAPTPPYNYFGDQTLVHHYHWNRSLVTVLPQAYNVIYFGKLKNFKNEQTIGFHDKFWRRERWFSEWRKRMMATRKFQLEQGHSYLVPSIPKKLNEWTMVQESGWMGETVHMVSFGAISQEQIEIRQQVAEFNLQAICTIEKRGVELHELLKRLLEGSYNANGSWVLILFPEAQMAGTSSPIVLELARFAAIFGFCDSI